MARWNEGCLPAFFFVGSHKSMHRPLETDPFPLLNLSTSAFFLRFPLLSPMKQRRPNQSPLQLSILSVGLLLSKHCITGVRPAIQVLLALFLSFFFRDLFLCCLFCLSLRLRFYFCSRCFCFNRKKIDYIDLFRKERHIPAATRSF